VIVLDTHAWVWWLSAPHRLSARARAAIGQASDLRVPAISCWEVATAVARGRIELDRDVGAWLAQALGAEKVELAPLTPSIAVAAAGLPRDFTGDPGDRLIAATAMALRCPLVTKDAQLRALPSLATIW
jgi:PIN domain nuclease of toxin-antitoxin system